MLGEIPIHQADGLAQGFSADNPFPSCRPGPIEHNRVGGVGLVPE